MLDLAMAMIVVDFGTVFCSAFKGATSFSPHEHKPTKLRAHSEQSCQESRVVHVDRYGDNKTLATRARSG